MHMNHSSPCERRLPNEGVEKAHQRQFLFHKSLNLQSAFSEDFLEKDFFYSLNLMSERCVQALTITRLPTHSGEFSVPTMKCATSAREMVGNPVSASVSPTR